MTAYAVVRAAGRPQEMAECCQTRRKTAAISDREVIGRKTPLGRGMTSPYRYLRISRLGR